MEIELSLELLFTERATLVLLTVAAGMPREVYLLVLGRRGGGCQVLPFLLLPWLVRGCSPSVLCVSLDRGYYNMDCLVGGRE